MAFISLLTTVFNGEDFIYRCYSNLLDQTFVDWEWVCVNDGSTDGTLAKLEAINDSRLKIISYPNNLGRGRARNLGIDNCDGKWIACFDVDDLHFPEKLNLVFENSKLGYDFFCSYSILVDNNLNVKGYRGFSEPSYIFPRGFMHPTLAVKSEILKSIKYSINPGKGGPGEDARVLWILSLNYSGFWYDDALTIYQEDREVNLRKAFWSNFAHFKTIIDLKKEGYFKLNFDFIIIFLMYFLKLCILFFLHLFPFVYKYSVKFRNKGIVHKDWKISSSKIEYINSYSSFS